MANDFVEGLISTQYVTSATICCTLSVDMFVCSMVLSKIKSVPFINANTLYYFRLWAIRL